MLKVRFHGGALPALLIAPALLVAACGTGGGQSTEGEAASGFEGETIHFVVSFSPGGGYDTIARAIAPHLEEELGATVVVENEDGAGGLLAANQIYTAEPDGLRIGLFNGQGIAGASLGEAQGAQFELDKFSYVARLSAEERVMVASPGGDYETIEEIRDGQDVDYATAGTGAADNIDANVLTEVLGIEGRIVTGYEGSEETALAVTSGDVEIGSGTVASRLSGIESGDLDPVLVISDEPSDALPDVPVLTDLSLDEQSSALAEDHLRLQAMGRMVWAPPAMPEEQLADLEAAFEAASENPEFLKQMEKTGESIDFTSGADAKADADEVLDAPDDYTELLKNAFSGQ